MVTIATVHSQKIHLKTRLPRAVFQFWIVTFTTPVHRLVLENWFGTAVIHFWVTWQLHLPHHLNWPRCHKIWYCLHCSRKKKKAIRCSFKNQIQRIRMSFLILNDFQSLCDRVTAFCWDLCHYNTSPPRAANKCYRGLVSFLFPWSVS